VGGEGTAISRKVYERLCERERIIYSTFHERLQKLEYLRLLDLTVRQEKGRRREIFVREGVEEVLQVPVGGVAEPGYCHSWG